MIVAATGHRPAKVGGFTDSGANRLQRLAREYMRERGVTHAISGMALGWDTAWALAALERGIPLTCAVAFDGQEAEWRKEQQALYHDILRKAVKVKYVSPPGYAAWKFQRRNEWMTDHCDRLAALWDGSSGGTRNCLSYAMARTPPVPWDNLWPRYQELAAPPAPLRSRKAGT